MTNKRTSMTLQEIREAAEAVVGRHAFNADIGTEKLMLAWACLDLLDTIEKLRSVRKNLDLDSEWFDQHGPWRE